jgi:hypothetical protein
MPAYMVCVRPGRDCASAAAVCYVAPAKALKNAPPDVLAWGWRKVIAPDEESARSVGMRNVSERGLGLALRPLVSPA